MIETYDKGKWISKDNLLEAIGIDVQNQPIISLVGGGGKTTASRRLMLDFVNCNLTPIVTTTTHMQKEAEEWYLGTENLMLLKDYLNHYGRVWLGISCGETMMKSCSLEFLHDVVSLGVPVIIEADGAKMMPCKVPAEKEPVVLKETTHLLAVYGMDAMGKSLKEVCFRLELVKSFLGKSEEELLMPEDIVKMALSESGGKKHWTPTMDYHVILNKTDDAEREKYTDEIAGMLEEHGIRVSRTSFLLDQKYLGGRFS